MDDVDLFPCVASSLAEVLSVDEDAEAWREAPTSPDLLVDLASEQSTLGAIMLDHTLLADVCAIAPRDDFADPRHGTILDALVAIDGQPNAVNENGSVSIPALCAQLRTMSPGLNTVGGAQYLAALYRRLPSAVQARAYAATVAELATRRRLREVATDLQKRAADTRTPVDVVADKALRAVERASKGSVAASSQVSVGVALQRVADRVGVVETRGLPLPWPSIDHALGGLRGGRTHYLAAKTSMGKSSFARNLATALAAPSVYYDVSDERAALPATPVLFFALEMKTDENAVQVMASVLRCSGADVERGNVNMEQYCDALRVLDGAPLVFDDATDNAAQMLALARQFVRKHKRDGARQAAVVIDYLQLCDPFGLAMEKNPTRERMVAVMSREWTRFAIREDVPVVILSQLNRDCEDEECPKLKHLRESGSVEQDADVVAFLWGKLPESGALTQEITCTLAKIRGGPRGLAVPMLFHRASTRFYEAATAGLYAPRESNVVSIHDARTRTGRATEHDDRFTQEPEGTNDDF